MKRQPTPQHLTWFLDMYRNNQLELNPPYQRKSVWSPNDRRFFLDTIFRNYPAPPIFIHREVDDKGFTMFNVVDGKQRLETIIQFVNNKIAIAKNFGDVNLDGKKFKDLSVEYKRIFWDYVIVVDFIDSIEGTNIDEVFDRVNRNSKNLQPQELRHARFDGWFIKEAEEESEDKFWDQIKVSTTAKDKRMRNVQFVSELLFIILENKIVGFSQDYIDEMYAKYDVLDDLGEDFEVEEFKNKKEKVKKYFADMNAYNGCIDTYCKTANNIHTLWAFLALNTEVSSVTELANKYSSFMSEVQDFIDNKTPEEETSEMDKQSYLYYINSKGAATEAPQRKERLRMLTDVLS